MIIYFFISTIANLDGNYIAKIAKNIVDRDKISSKIFTVEKSSNISTSNDVSDHGF